MSRQIRNTVLLLEEFVYVTFLGRAGLRRQSYKYSTGRQSSRGWLVVVATDLQNKFLWGKYQISL